MSRLCFSQARQGVSLRARRLRYSYVEIIFSTRRNPPGALGETRPTSSLTSPCYSQLWRQSILRSKNPGPIFGALTQTFSHRIRQNVTGFFAHFMVATQAMVKEISLPANPLLVRQIPFPVCD